MAWNPKSTKGQGPPQAEPKTAGLESAVAGGGAGVGVGKSATSGLASASGSKSGSASASAPSGDGAPQTSAGAKNSASEASTNERAEKGAGVVTGMTGVTGGAVVTTGSLDANGGQIYVPTAPQHVNGAAVTGLGAIGGVGVGLNAQIMQGQVMARGPVTGPPLIPAPQPQVPVQPPAAVRRHVGAPSSKDSNLLVDPTNLIINYIPPTMNEGALATLFSPYGTMNNIKIVVDPPTGRSRGYGFVKYESEVSAANAQRALNGYQVGGKTLKVTFARPQSKDIKNSNLYVTNIPVTWGEPQIRGFFQDCGTIIECRILRDMEGRSRGVGFVRMDCNANARRAIEMRNRVKPSDTDQAIVVKLAQRKNQRKMDRNGGHGGHGGGGHGGHGGHHRFGGHRGGGDRGGGGGGAHVGGGPVANGPPGMGDARGGGASGHRSYVPRDARRHGRSGPPPQYRPRVQHASVAPPAEEEGAMGPEPMYNGDYRPSAPRRGGSYRRGRGQGFGAQWAARGAPQQVKAPPVQPYAPHAQLLPGALPAAQLTGPGGYPNTSTFDIYVYNLPTHYNVDHLIQLYAPYGPVQSVRIERATSTQQLHGVVSYFYHDDARRAQNETHDRKVNDRRVDNRRLEVRFQPRS